jgi:hypothetical protein
MTESQDQPASLPATPASPGEPVQGHSQPTEPPGVTPTPVVVSTPIVVSTPSADQISKLVSHPAVKGYLGKSLKLIAFFAVLGCFLMLAAITALSNIINNALPH